MRSTVTVLAVLLLAAPAWADPPIASQAGSYRRSADYTGPYSVYGPGLTYRQPFFGSRPTFTSIAASTSVTVPDGGEALVAGCSTMSEGRNEFGTPGLGKTPYLDRGFRNVGSGRSVSRTTLSVKVRIINLAEEEERQTGVRPER
jgi:hypothetical protein